MENTSKRPEDEPSSLEPAEVSLRLANILLRRVEAYQELARFDRLQAEDYQNLIEYRGTMPQEEYIRLLEEAIAEIVADLLASAESYEQNVKESRERVNHLLSSSLERQTKNK